MVFKANFHNRTLLVFIIALELIIQKKPKERTTCCQQKKNHMRQQNDKDRNKYTTGVLNYYY